MGGVDGNTNKTDQQKFAKLDSHENGIMSSKVYTVEGTSATAVGREPIVRVELVDTVNNALVAMRYLKVKWVKEAWRRESCLMLLLILSITAATTPVVSVLRK